MKSKWACWIGIISLASFAMTARGEAWGGNIFLAADTGSFSTTGYKVDSSPVTTARVSIGWQPHEGWGMGVGSSSNQFGVVGRNSCPGGCGAPIYAQNTVDTVDVTDVFASYSEPLSERIALTGKIGVAQSHYIAYAVNPNQRFETTANNLEGGVGVQMRLFKKVGLQLQLDEIFTRSNGSGITRFNFVSAGLFLKF